MTHQGEKRTIGQTREVIQSIMDEYGVIGLSISLKQGKYWTESPTSYELDLGWENPEKRKSIDSSTIFPAGNLGQPVLAYIVLELASMGKFDIDRPLYKDLLKPLSEYSHWRDLKNDERYKRLTARRILSHQSGLAYSRASSPDHRLAFEAESGKNFAYSDDAYALLPCVLEQITGRTFGDLAKSLVFAPLGMSQSSFVLEPRFKGHLAVLGSSQADQGDREAEGRLEFFTTPADFTKFSWIAVMTGLDLAYEPLLSYIGYPEVTVRTSTIYGRFRSGSRPALPKGLSWFLGWGRYVLPHVLLDNCFFIGQRNQGIDGYAMAYESQKSLALTILYSSNNHNSPMSRIVKEILGEIETPLVWLGF
jgi:CubicO group peptidase (beta-lactamase class C family)